MLEDGKAVRREVEQKNPGTRVRLVRRDGTVDDPENEGDHPPKKLEDQRGGGGFEVPESWRATVEEMRAEGPLSIEEHEARQAEADRLRMN